MQLTRWTRTADFETLRQQMDRMMRETERLFGSLMPSWAGPRAIMPGEARETTWIPTCDVNLQANEYIITCELPGVEPRDVEVNSTRNTVTISGEAKEESCPKGTECMIHERICGKFYRQFELPEEIDSERTVARFKNGLLMITVPLMEGARRKAHKVAIEAAK